VTAITAKKNIQLIDIVSTRMLGQYGFLAEVSICLIVLLLIAIIDSEDIHQVFNAFEECKVSVDVVSSSDVSVSLTLDKQQRENSDIPKLLVSTMMNDQRSWVIIPM
jgi:aspartate kinase